MNKKGEIRKSLLEWFDIMVNKYSWLQIKYEYNELKDIYLVSFCIGSDIENFEFEQDVLLFEEVLDNKFGDDSPLFCDNESLFRLSANAETISRQVSNVFTNEIYEDTVQFDLVCKLEQQYVGTDNSSDEFCYNEPKYDMAA